MWTTTEILRLLAVVQLLMLAAVLVRDHWADRSARASLAFLAACGADLLFPLVVARQVGPPVLDLWFVACMAVPFTFLVLAEVHFVDEFRMCPWHGLAILVGLAAGYVAWLAGLERLPALAGNASSAAFWRAVPQLISIGVVTHALLTVYAGARSDLVLSRLRLRYVVLLSAGGYILLESLATALFRGSAAEATADRVHAASVFLVTLSLVVLSLRLRPEVLRPAPVASPGPVLDPRLAVELVRLIEEEQVFREEGLTISAMAERLGAHEYKVRQLINAQLGFKNFNAFVNHYRIREAREVLVDPVRQHLGVAEVAYQVGFRSLGPFNKAFKELSGRTPTEYRASCRARSTDSEREDAHPVPAEPVA